MQQDSNESNETTVKETEGYDKNSVRKDIINLKNDMQNIKEALKSLLTKRQSKHEQEIPYQPGKKKPIAQGNILKVITQKKQIQISKRKKTKQNLKKKFYQMI